jgi:hypothetical protein
MGDSGWQILIACQKRDYQLLWFVELHCFENVNERDGIRVGLEGEGSRERKSGDEEMRR